MLSTYHQLLVAIERCPDRRESMRLIRLAEKAHRMEQAAQESLRQQNQGLRQNISR